MLNSIMTSTLKARFLVLFAAAALLVVGGIQLSRKSFDLLPEFSPPGVEVQTEAIGLAAAEVEALITVQLEEILSGVPWLQSMDSTSIDGLSSIVMRFDPDTDVMAARQMVQERLLHSTKLPKVAKRPVMLQPRGPIRPQNRRHLRHRRRVRRVRRTGRPHRARSVQSAAGARERHAREADSRSASRSRRRTPGSRTVATRAGPRGA